MRFALLIAYDGTAYSGWQKQPNAPSVQHEMDRALSILLKEPIFCVGCGRTDAGVHANNFWLHFDFGDAIDAQYMLKLNGILPHDIVAKKLVQVADDFNARFDATYREYRYFIYRKPNPFIQNKAYYFSPELNIQAMNEACAIMLNHKAFGSFCKAGGNNKTTTCQVSLARWYAKGDLVVFRIKADRFLRNMVRAAVGTLLMVGQGRISVAEFEQILQKEKRQAAGRSAPGWALYLWDIGYPDME